MSFGYFRNLTLTNFFSKGGILHAIYLHNATTLLSNSSPKIINYSAYLTKYLNNIFDHSIIKIDIKEFSMQITGAMYKISDTAIVTESRQITQIDNKNNMLWAIKLGNNASSRVEDINNFLRENGAGSLAK